MPTTTTSSSTSGELIVIGLVLVVLGILGGWSATVILVGGLAVAVGIAENRAAWQA